MRSDRQTARLDASGTGQDGSGHGGRGHSLAALFRLIGVREVDPPIGPGETAASPRVLVVDDSDVARHALASVLQVAGFDITQARSALEAESLIDGRAAGDVDLVLMDLHMPGMSGIDACARLKRRAGWEDVPVIVITASDDHHDLTLAFAAGATDYLTKPPRDFELLARVGAALRLKHEMTRRRVRETELEALNRRLCDQTDELSAAKRALQELNQELEQRVTAQVDEIVARAREVEELNAQLRVQVQERSRELAEALRHVSAARGARPRQFTRGRVLGGRVQLLRHLAGGGMGVIYTARDLVTGSAVAVKLLDTRLGSTEKDLQRFIHEAEATAAIAHPAIVKISHVDVADDGELFLIMELVEGVTLGKALRRGPLPPAWCASLAHVVADALAAAHRVNIVHRDVKPANLMISRRTPGVRVLDFGISKIRSWTDRVTLTRTDGVLGTPAYMAPEQFEDASVVTAGADVYSLGAVMFEMIAGVRPFPDLKTLLDRTGRRPRLADVAANVPRKLTAIIDRCLDRNPGARPSARELAGQLAALATELDAPPPHQLLDAARRYRGRPVAADAES